MCFINMEFTVPYPVNGTTDSHKTQHLIHPLFTSLFWDSEQNKTDVIPCTYKRRVICTSSSKDYVATHEVFS